jgi:phage terminase large subunit
MATETVSLRELVKPHARQLEFFEAIKQFRYVLYGGARGGGKSYILRWALVWFALQLTKLGFRNCILGLFCISFPELRLRQIEPIKREFPSWLGSWNESEKGFRFYEEYGGHVIKCCNLDDPEKYKSAEFAGIAVDELTLIVSKAIFDTLRGSLRWPGLARPIFIAGTNPDGPGHSWVKRLWVTRDFSHPDDALLPAKEFAFVRSLPTDNPHLAESYINEELASQPESVRKAWLEGSWDLFEGQRFHINPAVHVCRPFDLGPRVRYYASIDYGFDNPFALGIYGVLPKEEGQTWIYKVKELNVRGLKAREQAKLVKETLKENGITLASAAYLDTACWKEEDDGLSIAMKFIQEGVPVQQVLKDRATGWVALEDLLYYKADEDRVVQEPQMKIWDCCPMTLQQATDAVWDPKKPGDIMHPEGFRDDNLDETRYFALTHIRGAKPTVQSTEFEHMKLVEKHMRKFKRR